MEVKAIKCPCCGANVEYDGTQQFVRCEYCGTEFAVELDAPQEAQAKGTLTEEDVEMKRLELRQQRREARHERHEKHREERHARHDKRREERHERRMRGFI